jgi:hypothetical protein
MRHWSHADVTLPCVLTGARVVSPSQATAEARIHLDGEVKVLDLRRALNEIRATDIGHTENAAISEIIVDWHAADDMASSSEARTTRKTKIPAHDLVMAVWTHFEPLPQARAEEADTETEAVSLAEAASSEALAVALPNADGDDQQSVDVAAPGAAPAFEFPIFTDTATGAAEPAEVVLSEDPPTSSEAHADVDADADDENDAGVYSVMRHPGDEAGEAPGASRVPEIPTRTLDLSPEARRTAPDGAPDPGPDNSAAEHTYGNDVVVVESEDDGIYEMPDRSLASASVPPADPQAPPVPPPRSTAPALELDDSSDDDIYEAPVLASATVTPPRAADEVLDMVTVTKQPGERWGLTVELRGGVFVLGRDATAGGPAADVPQLKKGAAILSVDGLSTLGWSKQQLGEQLKGKSTLSLGVRPFQVVEAPPAFH